MSKTLNFFLLLALISCFFSCSKQEVDRTSYIPANSSLVVKFNAKSFFKDSFDDFIQHGKEVYKNIVSEDLGILLAPELLGIDRFEAHYAFVSSLDTGKEISGLVIALDSPSKLKKYLESSKFQVTQETGWSKCQLNKNTTLVWDEQTAILKYCPDGLSSHETVGLMSNGKSFGASSSSGMQSFKSAQQHFAVWLEKEKKQQLMQVLQKQFFEELGISLPLILYLQAPEVITFEIESDRVIVNSFTYLTQNQIAELDSLGPKSQLDKNMFFVPKKQPKAWFSANLNEQDMLRVVNNNESLQGLINDYLGSFLTIEEVCSFLNGQVFVAYNGVDVREKSVFESEFNPKTGEYKSTQERKEVQQLHFTAALGLKDSEAFREMIAPLSLFLSEDKGVYNYNEEYFFKIDQSRLLLGTSPQSKLLFNSKQYHFNDTAINVAQENYIAAFCAFSSMGKDKPSKLDLHSFKLNKWTMDNGIGERAYVFEFKKGSNAFVQLSSVLLNVLRNN